MKSINYDIIPATQEETTFIDDKLGKFNRSQIHVTQEQTGGLKNYIIKDRGTIIAGITSRIYRWGILYIEVLFVDENHRHKGLGSTLLKKVEQEAKEMGANLAHLDTYDFQALDFYLKHGYEVFGVLEDCPKDHKRYYLKKKM
jgi:GNAT superfamily N-acetyltransferase